MPRELHGWLAERKSDHKVRGRPKNYISAEDSPPGREKKGADRRETGCYVTLGTGLTPDGAGLRRWDRSEMYETL